MYIQEDSNYLHIYNNDDQFVRLVPWNPSTDRYQIINEDTFIHWKGPTGVYKEKYKIIGRDLYCA